MSDKEPKTAFDIMEKVSAQIRERTGLSYELLGEDLTRHGIAIGKMGADGKLKRIDRSDFYIDPENVIE